MWCNVKTRLLKSHSDSAVHCHLHDVNLVTQVLFEHSSSLIVDTV